MTKPFLQVLFPALLLFSCKELPKQQAAIPMPVLQITCENEKLLLEPPGNSRPYSFDTIASTSRYRELIRMDQAATGKNNSYSGICVIADTPSIYRKIDISLIGSDKLNNDGRLKSAFYTGHIDSKFAEEFYTRVATQDNTTAIRNKAEIFLGFPGDSIKGIEASVKTIAAAYLSSQRKNALLLFGKELCSLDNKQLDSIKQKTPFRIRLMRAN